MQDPDLQFRFAVFMVDTSKMLPIPELTLANVIDIEKAINKCEDLIKKVLRPECIVVIASSSGFGM
jgi:hypothetical protein